METENDAIPQEEQQSDSGNRDYEKEIAKLRQEAAKYRTERNELRGQVKELSPAAQKFAEFQESQKTEVQKMQDKLAQLEADKAAAIAQATAVQRQNKVITLANKAGVDPEIALLLDASKLDLDNEQAALETLEKLSPKNKSTGGSVVNPQQTSNGTPSAADWYKSLSGGRTSKLFGG